VALAVALATIFLGWVVWAALGAADPGPGADVTAFRVVSDDEIEVRVTATSRVDGPFDCSLQALDRTREVVGVAAVALGTGREGRTQRWVSVRTRDRAVTATVGRCTARA
jgi:hypothetical protein